MSTEEPLYDTTPAAVARRDQLYAATQSKQFPSKDFDEQRQNLLLAKTLAGPQAFADITSSIEEQHALLLQHGRSAETLQAVEALQSKLHDDAQRLKTISQTLTSATLDQDIAAAVHAHQQALEVESDGSDSWIFMGDGKSSNNGRQTKKSIDNNGFLALMNNDEFRQHVQDHHEKKSSMILNQPMVVYNKEMQNEETQNEETQNEETQNEETQNEETQNEETESEETEKAKKAKTTKTTKTHHHQHRDSLMELSQEFLHAYQNSGDKEMANEDTNGDLCDLLIPINAPNDIMKNQETYEVLGTVVHPKKNNMDERNRLIKGNRC
jgi:hypothetical protein